MIDFACVSSTTPTWGNDPRWCTLGIAATEAERNKLAADRASSAPVQDVHRRVAAITPPARLAAVFLLASTGLLAVAYLLRGLPADPALLVLRRAEPAFRSAPARSDERRDTSDSAAPVGPPEAPLRLRYDAAVPTTPLGQPPVPVLMEAGTSAGRPPAGAPRSRNLSDLQQAGLQVSATELLDQYTQLHMAMTVAKEREPRALVVHFHNDAGVANRAGVLVSALALALATQRALLVEWPPVQAHWHPSREYIALPGLGDLFELPPGPAWSWRQARTWLPRGHECASAGGAAAGGASCLDLQTPGSPALGALLCGNLSGGTGGPPALAEPVAHLQSWDYFLPLLRSNAAAAGALAALGPRPGSALARWLLRPVAALEERAAAFAEAHLAGRFAVGVHVRQQGYNGLSAEQVKALAGCAARVTSARPAAAGGAVWFVAADSRQGRALVARHAAGVPGVQVVYLDSPLDGAEWRGSTRGTQAALVELRVLALCDELVLSPGSTFGRAAHMWAGREAYVLAKAGPRAGTCPRKGTVDGCCHSWRDSLLGGRLADDAPGAAGYALPVPRLERAAWSCMTPEHLAHMGRFHSDCRAS
eukprot:jgi/Tetstr1/444855/TSEL_032697.t1